MQSPRPSINLSTGGSSRRALLGVSAAVLVALTGCASSPSPAMSGIPGVQVPTQWSENLASAPSEAAAAWWREFGSTELDGLIESALEANRDLHVAVARLAQARAISEGAQADRRPQLGAAAGLQRGRDSAGDPKTERSSIGLRASWEVDLFGRGVLAVDAAQADAQAAVYGLRAMRIALAADVAATYFELRTLQARIILERRAVELAQRQLNVAQRKFEAGQVTALDVERWQAELAQERASGEQFEGSLRVRQRQLALLLGVDRAPALGLEPVSTAPSAPASVLPGELLERRPDVRRQALALDAALARTGAARREVYPRLQIDWAGSRERLAIQGGSASPQAVLGYGISLTLPILDGGRIRANIAVQEARTQEAMAEYEKAMLTALADVETVLAQWSTAEAALREWRRAEVAGETAAMRSERLFEAGMIDLAIVLDARRGQVRAQDAVIQAEGVRWAAAVALRRAFAGGV